MLFSFSTLSDTLLTPICFFFSCLLSLQQFGKILDVEIIFNERGSKVSELERQLLHYHVLPLFPNDGISAVCTLAENSGLYARSWRDAAIRHDSFSPSFALLPLFFPFCFCCCCFRIISPVNQSVIERFLNSLNSRAGRRS